MSINKPKWPQVSESELKLKVLPAKVHVRNSDAA